MITAAILGSRLDSSTPGGMALTPQRGPGGGPAGAGRSAQSVPGQEDTRPGDSQTCKLADLSRSHGRGLSGGQNGEGQMVGCERARARRVTIKDPRPLQVPPRTPRHSIPQASPRSALCQALSRKRASEIDAHGSSCAALNMHPLQVEAPPSRCVLPAPHADSKPPPKNRIVPSRARAMQHAN
jgi:hypothetical protein